MKPVLWPAGLAGAAALVLVGSTVAVSALLADAPLFTSQALRYGGACVALLLSTWATRRRVAVPRGVEWLWLIGVASLGLVLFNVALIAGARHAEPAALGVAVACVPLILAVAGPLLEGRRPQRGVLAAAALVTVGAGLVEGVGRTDAQGLFWAAVILGCEAGFTLLAVPVLARHGAWWVSAHTTWLAALIFAAVGLLREGPRAVVRLTTADALVIGYQAVVVTALAFVLWYFAVSRLGAGRAGLLTGLAPASAAAIGVLLGKPAPTPLVWLGLATVAAGLALGLSRTNRAPSARAQQSPDRP